MSYIVSDVSIRNLTLGQRIRAARERQMPKMSQKRLAELVGVITKTVNNWENDRSVPAGRMGRLQVILGSVDLSWTGDPDEPTAKVRTPQPVTEADTERFIWLLHTR